MSPVRATRPVALAFLLLAPLASAAPVPDAAGERFRADVRSPVVEHLLLAAHAAPLLKPALDAPPALETLLVFAQPVARSEDDLLSVLWVRPFAHEWSGVWGADSSAGVASPRKVTIGPEGLFLSVSGGSLATGDRVSVTYTFVGDDGRGWSIAAPTVPVLDKAKGRSVVLAGAGASDHGHDDLPEIVLLSVWNLLQRDARMGFTVLDADGTTIEDVTAGDCPAGAGNLTQAGCRAAYVMPRRGARIVTWEEAPDGTREHHESHALADILEKPFVFGANKMDREPRVPLLDARVRLGPSSSR